jgi:hypothetical protein
MQLFPHFPCHYTTTSAPLMISLALILSGAEFSFNAAAILTVKRNKYNSTKKIHHLLSVYYD